MRWILLAALAVWLAGDRARDERVSLRLPVGDRRLREVAANSAAVHVEFGAQTLLESS